MLYFPPPFKFCGNFGDADDDDIQVGLTPSSELEYRSRGDGRGPCWTNFVRIFHTAW